MEWQLLLWLCSLLCSTLPRRIPNWWTGYGVTCPVCHQCPQCLLCPTFQALGKSTVNVCRWDIFHTIEPYMSCLFCHLSSVCVSECLASCYSSNICWCFPETEWLHQQRMVVNQGWILMRSVASWINPLCWKIVITTGTFKNRHFQKIGGFRIYFHFLFFLLTTYLFGVRGRVHIWAKAGFTPGWVTSSVQGSMWAFGGSVPCSRLLQQCSEGVLQPLPATRTPSRIVLEPRTLCFSAYSLQTKFVFYIFDIEIQIWKHCTSISFSFSFCYCSILLLNV